MESEESIATTYYNSLYRHGVDEKRRIQVPAKWRPSKLNHKFTAAPGSLSSVCTTCPVATSQTRTAVATTPGPPAVITFGRFGQLPEPLQT